MAHESFEDPDVAAVMNRLFVNVKVDREERPDVDAHLHAGGPGDDRARRLADDGVPRPGRPPVLRRHVLPEGGPAGHARLPARDRRGRRGVAHQTRRARRAGGQAPTAIERARSRARCGGSTAELSDDVLDPGVRAASGRSSSRASAGSGGAPKFPQAMTLDFLLRCHVRNESPETLEMVTVSLDAMAAGGMYDQVGGGFHRYSVDDVLARPPLREDALRPGAARRRVPARVPGHRRAALPARRRGDDRVRAARPPAHGGAAFFSAEDADSEGVEGKFYVWSVEEIEALGGDDAAEVIRYFGVTPAGTSRTRTPAARGNILHVVDRTEERPEAVAASAPAAVRGPGGARAPRARRQGAARLGTRCSCASLAEAAAALERDDWMEAARANAPFLLSEMRRDDGRLLRSWQDGRARHLAYAEDYAALLEALRHAGRGRRRRRGSAEARGRRRAAAALPRRRARAGSSRPATDAEALIVRPKDVQDNATPAENSLAADGLLRLAALTGERAYEDAGRRGAARAGAGDGRAPDRVRVPARARSSGRSTAAAGDRGRG